MEGLVVPAVQVVQDLLVVRHHTADRRRRLPHFLNLLLRCL